MTTEGDAAVLATAPTETANPTTTKTRCWGIEIPTHLAMLATTTLLGLAAGFAFFPAEETAAMATNKRS